MMNEHLQGCYHINEKFRIVVDFYRKIVCFLSFLNLSQIAFHFDIEINLCLRKVINK